MATISKKFYIDLVNGEFCTTSAADLDAAFVAWKADADHNRHLVVHFHGGLVGRAVGMQVAENLLPVYYDQAKTYPLFVVWNAGALDVLQNNFLSILTKTIIEIGGEDIFTAVTKRVGDFLKSKVGIQESAVLSENASTPLYKVEVVPDSMHTLSPDEEALLARELATDVSLVEAARLLDVEAAVLPSNNQEAAEIESAVVPTRHRKTMISPQVVKDIRSQQASLGGQPETDALLPESGIASIALGRLIEGGVKISRKMIERYQRGRDHGFFPTLVEETLREFYIGAFGAALWDQMKQDTGDAYGGDPSKHGGTALLCGMKAAWNEGNKSKITLVGHSTGAVAICHLLEAMEREQMPSEMKINIILLAPACTLKLFTDTMAAHKNRVESLRIFGMQDELECQDAMVPHLYTRSLLYFVSGLLEKETDTPLVGMQRFHNHQLYPDAQHMNTLLQTWTNSTIWSETLTNALSGCATGSRAHGDFDNDPQTLSSLAHMLQV